MGGVVEPPTKFSKRGGGCDRTSTFRGELQEKRGVTFFRVGGGGRGGGVGGGGGGESLQFLRKNKIKSEIFNDKKVYKQKIFFSVITKNSGWEILTISYF